MQDHDCRYDPVACHVWELHKQRESGRSGQ